VLFAVIVMGIGFIMIAAIFPVAIQQNKASNDETIGASVARGFVSRISRLASDDRNPAPPPAETVFPPTGISLADLQGRVRPVDFDYGWRRIRGSLIFPDDPRYAVVPLYRRNGIVAQTNTWAGTAQLYMFVVQCRGTNRPAGATPAPAFPARLTLEFDNTDINRAYTLTAPINNPNNLAARLIQIQLTDGGAAGADLLKVKQAVDLNAPPAQNLPDAVAEGCYVVTAEAGRIYRVGLRRTDLDDGTHYFYELQPGSDITDPANENIAADAPAWVVGKERLPDGSFVGPAQDVSIYTTFVPVKP
jgi:hypothetical protein